MYWQRKALYSTALMSCSNLNPFNTDLGAFSMSVELQSAKKVLVQQKYELFFVYAQKIQKVIFYLKSGYKRSF